MSTNHPTQCTVALRTLTRCQLKALFLPSKRKGLSQQVALNEVYALARLTFHENLLIGQETSARCPHQRVSVLSRLT